MRKFLTLFTAGIILIISSCATNSDIDNLQSQIDGLKSGQIATIESQINSINGSITSLQEADREIKGYIAALQNTASELQKSMNSADGKIDDLEKALVLVNTAIENLQAKDTALEKRISDLKDYVDSQLKNAKDWVSATFATLEQYNGIVSEIGGIKGSISSIKTAMEQMESRLNGTITLMKGEIEEAYTKAIGALESSLKNWVNEQLEGYWTIAETEGKLDALRGSLEKEDESIRGDIDKLRSSLDSAKTELTEGYKAAIKKAIEENNGVLDGKLSEAVSSLNTRIDDEVSTINERIDGIVERVASLEAQVTALVSRIQSLAYIPRYTDGASTMWLKTLSDGSIEARDTLDFRVSPAECADELVKVWEKAVSAEAVSLLSRSSQVTAALPVVSVTGGDGKISVVLDGSSLSEEFYSGEQQMKVVIIISDGNNERTSEYISMVAVSKIKYSYNLTIVGPGAVDEYLLKTKGSLENGTTIQLKAYPDITKYAKFKGWSGDVIGNEAEITFNLDKDVNVVATFAAEVRQYPQPNLYTPTSCRKCLYYGQDFSKQSWYPTGFLALDYNQDGYIDVVTCNSQYTETGRNPIGFYLGQTNGSFVEDNLNSGKFMGLIAVRKSFYGDFNGDSIPDICFVGHGWDEEPWPGEYPILLLSNGKRYEELRLYDTVGYFHGSAAGDFDNDGDLDIFLLDHSTNSWFLVNDGQGHFTKNNTLFNVEVIDGSMFTTEMFDINHDGFLDLIVGGHEHEGHEWHEYTNPTIVFWGNGESFNHDNYVRFPRFKDGWGVTLDYCFYDLNGDGKEEVINIRTGDGLSQPSYQGWSLQILSLNGDCFYDVTSSFIYDNENGELDGSAFCWIDMEEIEGEIYLCGRFQTNAERLFILKDGRLQRVNEDNSQPLEYSSGMCFYSDGVGSWNEHTQLDCQDDPYSGTTCIHVSNWVTWTGWAVDYKDWIDFSELEKQDYVLEFAIKNSDPDLVIAFHFETRLQTDPWYFPSYRYSYLASEHKCDGTWELVRVPLSSLKCEPEWTGYYWKTIKTLSIMPGDCHGKDFYLDEIRIRKVLPE